MAVSLRARLALPLLLALAACGSPAPDLPSGPARPPMWVVHDADTRIVILGSVHQLPRGLDWTGGRLAVELRLADELLLELPPAESAAAGDLFDALADDEPVQSLATRFGEEAAAVRRLAGEAGVSPARADRMESWALALAIGNALSRGQGLSTDQGVEAVLTGRFQGADRPVAGLESARAQLDMFDTLPPRQQDAMVQAAITGADEGAARTRRLLAAWASGDVEALTAVADNAMAKTPFLIEPVIHARNRAWADALARRLERRGDVMVAVGVGHLVGDGSLLDELRSRGLRPMRLQ